MPKASPSSAKYKKLTIKVDRAVDDSQLIAAVLTFIREKLNCELASVVISGFDGAQVPKTEGTFFGYKGPEVPIDDSVLESDTTNPLHYALFDWSKNEISKPAVAVYDESELESDPVDTDQHRRIKAGRQALLAVIYIQFQVKKISRPRRKLITRRD